MPTADPALSTAKLPERLRVVRLVPALDFGGVESRITLQAALHSRKLFDLRVATLGRAGNAADAVRQKGVGVDVLEQPASVRNAGTTLALARYLRRVRPHILHSSIVEANFHAILASLGARPRVLITEEVGVPSHKAAARLAFRLLYARCQAVIGVTQAVCDYVTQVDGCAPDRVRLVYNCAGPDYFPERPAPRAPRDPGRPFRLLAVGRLVPVKNHETLLRAFAVVARRHPDVRLAIAGSGPLEGQLRSISESLGLQRHVEWLGFRSDVRALLATADAFVLPSHSEGCSISLIEAMATGVPALGSRVPGILEVLGPTAHGNTAPAADVAAWVNLLDRFVTLDARELAQIAEQSQRRAYELFSPKAYVRRLETLYRELFAQSGPTPQH